MTETERCDKCGETTGGGWELCPTCHGQPLVYLSFPYQHPDPVIQANRLDEARWQQGQMLLRNIAVYNWFDASCHLSVTLDEDAMRRVALTVLRHCDMVVVIGIDGWEESPDVQAEIEEARRHDIGVSMVSSNARTTVWDAVRAAASITHNTRHEEERG